MRRLTLMLAMLLATTGTVAAQDRAYEWVPVSTSAVGLAQATLGVGGQQANACFFSVETGGVRVRFDGVDPTTTVGHPFAAGSTFTLTGNTDLRRLRFVRSSGTDATVQATCSGTLQAFLSSTTAASSGSGAADTVTANAGTGTFTVAGTVTANAGSGTLAVSGPLTDSQLRASALPVSGTFYQPTQPVSGTFWQSTQPVSGTFWQSTQPVSVASTLTIKADTAGNQANALKTDGSATTQPVSGTFWQNTQPVSGPLTDTQLRASALPVSGTFWQSTQPVSLADNAARVLGAVSVTSAPTTAVTGTFWPTTAGAPTSTRLSDGAAFYDGRQIRALTSSDQVTVANASLAVTGTFWQSTQPVSGTFWQSTQPVSAASLPLPSNAAQETSGNLATIAGAIHTTTTGPTASDTVVWTQPATVTPVAMVTRGLPLQPCNPVRRTNCAPKGF